MPRKLKVVVEEPAIAAEPEVVEDEVSKAKPKASRKKPTAVLPPEPEETESSDESEEQPAAKARGRPKAEKKVREPSLWLECLRAHGYMLKGAGFKPTPKKGSSEYEAVKKDFDAKKAAKK